MIWRFFASPVNLLNIKKYVWFLHQGPDADLFPAQEALLHIQTKIVDLGPDKDNVITTRLLVPTCEIVSLEGFDGLLSEIQRLTSANIQILPKEDLPPCAMEADELVQVGSLKHL